MKQNRFALVIVVLLAMTSLFPQVSFAQEPEACAALSAQALIQMATNCAGTETGTVCYAFQEIDSVLADGVEQVTFDQAGERANLNDIVHIRPARPDVSSDLASEHEWGSAVARIFADLPAGYSQSTSIIVSGGAEVENGVEPEEAFIPTDSPLSLTTTADSELRRSSLTPPANGDVIGEVPAGSSVSADAISEDGQWLRVVFGESVGWISMSAVADDVSSLPTILDGQRTPFQDFYFRTGFAGNPCVESAPSYVLVQGPETASIDIVVHDITIRVGSTIMMRTTDNPGEPLGRTVELIVLWGVAEVNPDTPQSILVAPGYKLEMYLCETFASLGIEEDADERGCGEGEGVTFSDPILLTQEELGGICTAEGLPQNVINYSLSCPILSESSGSGDPIVVIICTDPVQCEQVRQLCLIGALPAATCDTFGFPHP